jgi:hypothetical protein
MLRKITTFVVCSDSVMNLVGIPIFALKMKFISSLPNIPHVIRILAINWSLALAGIIC